MSYEPEPCSLFLSFACPVGLTGSTACCPGFDCACVSSLACQRVEALSIAACIQDIGNGCESFAACIVCLISFTKVAFPIGLVNYMCTDPGQL